MPQIEEYKGRRLGYETRAILEALLKTNFEPAIKEGIWDFRKYGLEDYEIRIKEQNDRRIVMDGTAIKTELYIPFPHRWLFANFVHVNNATPPVLNKDSLAISLYRPQNSIAELPYNEQYLISVPDYTLDECDIIFPPSFQFPRTTYALTLNTTTAHRIYPYFQVTRLSK